MHANSNLNDSIRAQGPIKAQKSPKINQTIIEKNLNFQNCDFKLWVLIFAQFFFYSCNSTKRSTVKNRHRFVVHFVLTNRNLQFQSVQKAIFSYHNQIVKVKWLFRQNYKDSLTISILVSNLFSVFYCLNSLYLNPYIATKTPTITGTKLFSNKTVTLIDSCTYGKQDFLI